jgi:NADH:ubiquinone oxidoreductase subunit D
MEFYERCSGARMHAAFHSPSNLFVERIDKSFFFDILLFIKRCYFTLEEIHNTLTFNKIWKQRLLNIGSLTYEDCKSYNLTGVFARCCGLRYDVRLSKINNYAYYNKLKVKSYIGVNGDSFDRYLIRMLEMAESLEILNNVVSELHDNNTSDFKYSDLIINKNINICKSSRNTSMEDLIRHFLE